MLNGSPVLPTSLIVKKHGISMEKNIFIKIFRVNTAEYGTGPHLRYLCRVPVPVPGTDTDTEYGTGTYVRYRNR